MSTIVVTKTDVSACPNNGSFLQTPFWCEFKARHGWKYSRFSVSGKECGVLTRSFCKNMFSIAYIPLFPFFSGEEKKDAEKIASELRNTALALKPFLPKNTIAVRFDPDAVFDTPEERDSAVKEIAEAAKKHSLNVKKSGVDIQPPDSTCIDLTADEQEILGRMHSKWRYNIRLSARKGVVIQQYDGNAPNLSEKIDRFYELTKETNARDGNASHAKNYYLDLIRYSAEERAKGSDVPAVYLYIAEHEGDEIAAIMTLFRRDEAVYLYGASSNKKRSLMPNHLLQWTAITAAKQYGAKRYDFYGIPPEGKDEAHPMHGLYLFKTNFGGKNIHRPGSFDVPLSPLYGLYAFFESLRAFWHKVVLKKIRGR